MSARAMMNCWKRGREREREREREARGMNECECQATRDLFTDEA
jgi:hypothetical protein